MRPEQVALEGGVCCGKPLFIGADELLQRGVQFQTFSFRIFRPIGGKHYWDPEPARLDDAPLADARHDGFAAPAGDAGVSQTGWQPPLAVGGRSGGERVVAMRKRLSHKSGYAGHRFLLVSAVTGHDARILETDVR